MQPKLQGFHMDNIPLLHWVFVEDCCHATSGQGKTFPLTPDNMTAAPMVLWFCASFGGSTKSSRCKQPEAAPQCQGIRMGIHHICWVVDLPPGPHLPPGSLYALLSPALELSPFPLSLIPPLQCVRLTWRSFSTLLWRVDAAFTDWCTSVLQCSFH